MNASRILISCTTALAVVGAIGLANAQSTDTTTPPTPAPAQQTDTTTYPAAQDSTPAATGNTMGTTTTPADTSITELAAQRDRN